MKTTIAAAIVALALAAGAAAQITLINMIPPTRSGETNQDSEPTVTVNPADPLQIAGSAFTWDNLTGGPNIGPAAPLYVSTDGGQTWSLVLNVPSYGGGIYPTGDITIRFAASLSGTTSHLYSGILLAPFNNMTVLRSDDYRNPTVMTVLDTQMNRVDQPHVAATTSLIGDVGQDHVYVGFNNGYCCGVSTTGRTATIDWTLDGSAAAPPMTLSVVEQRSTGAVFEDGAAIVPAVHPDRTVYAIFYGFRSAGPDGSGLANSDVVVVRDDNNGNAGFASLLSGGVAGVQVVTTQVLAYNAWGGIGNQRLTSSNLAIAVDPNDSSRVYIAWADQPPLTANQTLHVRMSTDRGVTWSGDLLTLQDAISPALAVNSHGVIGFLYQQFAGSNWQTIFRRTTDAAGLLFDPGVMLSNTSSNAPALVFHPYLGDYIHLTTHNRDFYGIFSASNDPDPANFYPGVQYQRYVDWSSHTLFTDATMTVTVPISIDPFFFHSVELAPSDDYYVRDWTDSATSGDDGAEPSTHAFFYVTPDVWNRRGTLTGEPFGNDQPANEDAGNGLGIIGDNWAFARIRRNSSANAGSVTAHFVVSPLGTGSNFADASFPFPGLNMTAPDPPPVMFNVGETGPKITMPYDWHLDPVSSTHLCLGVEIDSANDHPLSPPFAGHAPGWGSGTDLAVLNDNNKAQRNMGLSTTPARGVGGKVTGYAVVHNAATFTRDMQLRHDARTAFGGRAEIAVVGGGAQDHVSADTITLAKMRPGENRWLAVTVPAEAVREGTVRVVNVDELKEGRVVNGFAVGIRGASLDRVLREALTGEASVFSRGAALHGSAAAKKLGTAARSLLVKRVDDAAWVAHAKATAGLRDRAVADLANAAGGRDPFDAMSRLEAVNRSIRTRDGPGLALALTTLTNALDSRMTMIELEQGNAADIPQTVRWQRDVFAAKALAHLPCASRLAQDSREVDAAFDRRQASWRDYPVFIARSRDCLASAAKSLGIDVASELSQLDRHASDPVRLQGAHSRILGRIASH